MFLNTNNRLKKLETLLVKRKHEEFNSENSVKLVYLVFRNGTWIERETKLDKQTYISKYGKDKKLCFACLHEREKR